MAACVWVVGCRRDSVGIGNWSTKNVDEQNCLFQIRNVNDNLEYSEFGDVVWVALVDERWFTSRQTCLATLHPSRVQPDFHMHCSP
jgi:hypothetical protein